MKKMIDKPLWMISFLWGNSDWARSDKYSEHQITCLTDVHPMEFIITAKDSNLMETGKVVGGYNVVMEMPSGTITEDQLDLWKENSSWLFITHLKEDI